MIRRLSWLFGAGIALASSRAGAVGPEGAPIDSSAYRVDLFQGPVLMSSRATGLAGAYAPIAEGVQGHAVNAASPAVREAYSYGWFDIDLDVGVTFPNGHPHTDWYNQGNSELSYDHFGFIELGANVQLGNWGFGASFRGQTFDVGPRDVPISGVGLTFLRGDLLLARSFYDGQLMLGIGTRIAQLTIESGNRGLFTTSSAGFQAGAILAPTAWPLRFAFTARTRMQPNAASNAADVQHDGVGTYLEATDGSGQRWYLPEAVEVPWELEMGVAWQLGPRPLNVRWINTHHPPDEYLEETKGANGETLHVRNVDHIEKKLRDRYHALPREKVLLVAALLVSGSVADGVGVESFLRRVVQRSGMKTSYTPRLGVEVEPIANVLQVRAGSYLEPTRFTTSTARPHATLGTDVRLFRWDVFGLLDSETSWRAGGFTDLARDYFAWGLTVGIWH